MSSQVVSFRLSEQEIQVLQSHAAVDGESNSSIAQRLFRELLGVSPASLDNRIQNVYDREITSLQDRLAALEQKVSENVNNTRQPVNTNLQDRLAALEQSQKTMQQTIDTFGEFINSQIEQSVLPLQSRVAGLEECLDFIQVMVAASKSKAPGLEMEDVENVQPQDQEQAVAEDNPAPLPEMVAGTETSTPALKNPNDETELIPTNELAVRMNCHKDTLIKARKDNRLPVVKNRLSAIPSDKKQGREIIWVVRKIE